jgi:phosphoenolpyruvate-protein kinase (PTS system EI component)
MPPAARLAAAFARAEERLRAAVAAADATLAPLLEAQALMLGDPELRDGTLARIEAGAEPVAAVRATSEELAALLEGAGSDYFRERAIDVRAVGTVLVEALTGAEAQPVPAGSIVIADELAPLDTARLADAGIAAFVTVRGGPTCHAAIVARAWGIPALVGAPRAVLDLADGTLVSLDGSDGVLMLGARHPSPCRGGEVSPRLTRRLPLYANVGSLAEARRAAALGAEGIGLLRTEFLFQDRPTPPGEDEQTAEYLAILQALDGRPVIARSLDIGADKPVPFLPLEAEPNPQLGLRGVRLCLREDGLFRTQLRALLRAAAAGPLKIMLPMVTTADEVRTVRALLAEEAAALELPVPPLGTMIEVPMAALAARELATVCDFFSLGTNDLLQFLLAADRQQAGVGYLHLADHPAVWPLLAGVIAAAHDTGIPVGVCGEWGADFAKLSRLLDLGIDSASVAPGALSRVRAWLPA